MKVILAGERNRGYESKDYNERTSRVHTIFQMTIESKELNPELANNLAPGEEVGNSRNFITISRLTVVDLGGSEGAVFNHLRHDRRYVNKSLLTLGNVISRITSESTPLHIPYRDSRLTRILQQSLSGNARVSLIATLSPLETDLDEAMNTLKFAYRSRKIPIRALENKLPDEKTLLRRFNLDVLELRKQLIEIDDGIKEDKVERFQSLLTRAALRERLDHLTKIILNSKTVTRKAILDWNDFAGTGAVILDGLLPQLAQIETTTSNTRIDQDGKRKPILAKRSQFDQKAFIRRQIEELDKRDEQIRNLELLISQLKTSNDDKVQAAISSFYVDPEKAVQSTDELMTEKYNLQREKREQDIVIMEQKKKLEMLEGNPKYDEMSLAVSQLRTALEEKESLTRALETRNQELKRQMESLELNEIERLQQLAGNNNIQRDNQERDIVIMEQKKKLETLERQVAVLAA
ncbi:hypothetical protein HDU76_001783, partial [Blyttiomyces sp. JEL0837]